MDVNNGYPVDMAASAPPMEMAEVQQRTQAFVTYAHALAKSILTPQSQSEDRLKGFFTFFKKVVVPLASVVAHALGDHSVSLIRGGNTYVTNNYGPSTTSRSSDKENKPTAGARIAAGVAGGAALGVLAYVTGKKTAESEDLAEEKNYFKYMKDFWEFDKNGYTLPNQLYIKDIVTHVENILERRRISKIQDFVLLFLGITAAGCALVGALSGSSTAMAIGVGAGVILGAAAIGKYAYYHFSQQEKRSAQVIQRICGLFKSFR